VYLPLAPTACQRRAILGASAATLRQEQWTAQLSSVDGSHAPYLLGAALSLSIIRQGAQASRALEATHDKSYIRRCRR